MKASHFHRPMGFTLVELLVVIGIISLLISILLPSLARARQAAVAVSCQSNLRQFGQAFLLYADQNKGWFPPRADTQPPTGGNPQTTSGKHWYEYIGDSGVLPEGTKGTGYVGYITGVWRCPAQPEDVVVQSNSGGYGWGGGYGPNTANVFRYTKYVSASGVPTRKGGVKQEWVANSSEVWLLGDTGRPSGTVPFYHTWNGTVAPTSTKPFVRDASVAGYNFRQEQPACVHPGDTANVLFFDGHVEPKTFAQLNANENDIFATKAKFNNKTN